MSDYSRLKPSVESFGIDHHRYFEKAIQGYIERLTGAQDPPLDDSELMEIHDFLQKTGERLWALGPTFRLATDKVEDLFRRAEEIRRARVIAHLRRG